MKKGFTLIELLAVIVILAVIAVIAVPIVLNIINDTKESATLRSAQFYMDGVEQALLLSRLNSGKVKDGKYSIMEDGNICLGTLNNNNNTCTGEILKVELKGDAPSTGTVTIKDGEIKKVDLILSDKEIWTDPFTGKIEYKLAPGVYDINDKLLASWDELDEIAYNKYGMDFKTLIESDEAYDEGCFDEGCGFKGYVGIVVDSIQGASQLVLDDSVTKVGENVISLSNNLINLIIPDSVTSIGDRAFSSTGLEAITIPSSVTSIGEYAFSYADLETITILSTEVNIADNAFEGSSLTTIYYKGNIEGATWIPEDVTVISDF